MATRVKGGEEELGAVLGKQPGWNYSERMMDQDRSMSMENSDRINKNREIFLDCFYE